MNKRCFMPNMYSLPGKNNLIILILMTLVLVSQTSCKKYLNKKPRQDLAVPSKLSDLQAILDFESFNGYSPGDLEFVADNYYLTNTSYNNSPITYRNSYVWDKNAIITSEDNWLIVYNNVYMANFVLDQLPKITVDQSQSNEYKNILGTALFHRSFKFYQLAQLFCKPHSSSANTDQGIILRLTPSLLSPTTRSTVQETYDQIIFDLKTAIPLLPAKSLFVTRPGRPAAMGLLARVYLSMRDYTNAGKYADSALIEVSTLLDYNSLSPASDPVLPLFKSNPEILYLSWEGFAPRLNTTFEQLIDSNLYQFYDPNDLRQSVFFGASTNPAGTYYWEGSYFNNTSPTTIFDGISTDELYLIRAESKAKNGLTPEAMSDLNTLLRNRWKTGTFIDLTATDAADAVNKVRTERRKELVFRGLRWTDLRRFNIEGENITPMRIVNGTYYTLPPNDLRWVLLIPNQEITRSGIPQNPR
jgi:starch-binding outer membrane protein, SusD/RagB family